jgi:hypothetical protein
MHGNVCALNVMLCLVCACMFVSFTRCAVQTFSKVKLVWMLEFLLLWVIFRLLKCEVSQVPTILHHEQVFIVILACIMYGCCRGVCRGR